MKPNGGKTLVILTPGFPADEADSTCVPPRQIFVKALKELNPDLNIIVLAFQYPFFSKTYQWHGVQVIALGGANKGHVFSLLNNIKAWLILRRLNKEHHLIGLLNFWLGKCALVGSKFAKKHSLKHYTWILGQDAKSGNKYVKQIKPTGNSLIALSDFIVREFTNNYDITPQHIIPVGIDATLFSSNNQQRDIDIVGAGSLIPLKQYHTFLEIIALLKPDFPNIKTAICGDGSEMKRLLTMIKELDIEANVALPGRMSHPEVLATMQRSKIFLHTSNYEGFGTVCLEALYAGAKVISFTKPMDADIENWYTAANKEHMCHLIKGLLQDANCTYQPVLPYPITNIVNSVLKLY